MRRLAFVVALTSLLAGCASLSPGTLAPASVDAPLEARIFPPFFGRVSFTTNKPAYVALFEIVPGQGMSLVYPAYGGQSRRVAEGTTWADLRFVPQRWMYSQTGFGSSVGPSRYFFLVASEAPLNLRRLRGASGLRSYFGLTRFVASRPWDAMEELAFAVVPRIDEDRWVTDAWADWGFDWGYGWAGSAFASSSLHRTTYCANGQVRFVSWWYIGNPCTGFQPQYLSQLAPGVLGVGGWSSTIVRRAPLAPAREEERSRAVATIDEGRTRLLREAARTRPWDAAARSALKESVVQRQEEARRSRTSPRGATSGGQGGVDYGRTRSARGAEPRPTPSTSTGSSGSATRESSGSTSSSGAERTRTTESGGGGGGRSRTP
jgi:hypothetical protein